MFALRNQIFEAEMLLTIRAKSKQGNRSVIVTK